MSVQREQALSKAFELIEADQLQEARTILKPILDTDKDNPDVWWLYAHAVTDPEAAHLALTNVRRLAPDYLNVSELLDALETRASAHLSGSASADGEPSFLPPVPSTLPGLLGAKAASEDDEPDFLDEEPDIPIFRRPVFLLILGSIIFVVIAVFVILRPPSEQENISVTPLITSQEISTNLPTVEFVATSPSDVTQQSTTLEPATSVGDLSGLYDALAPFDVPEDGISISQTNLGNTLVASVCTEAGRKLRDTLPEVIKTFAEQANDLSGEIQALGTRMVDCATNTTLLVIGVSINDAQAYAGGDLSDEVFQSRWQPIS